MSETEVPPLRADPTGLGPGEALTQAREEFSIPIEEMARRLRLSVATVRALEECDRATLPENAYVLGYVRAYARALDLDPKPYVSAYKKWLGEDAPIGGASALDAGAGDAPGRPWLPWVAVACLFAATAAVGVWWWQKGATPGPARLEEAHQAPAAASARPPEAPPASAGSASGASAVTETPAAPVVPAPTRAEAASGAREDGRVQAEGAPRSDSAAVAQREAAPAEDAAEAGAADRALPEGHHRLTLKFTSQSWTEVYDSDGKRLLFDLYQPGEVKRVEGKPPFKIRLGFAEGVQLAYDGEPVDLQPYVRPDSTARFTLGAAKEAQ